MAVPQITNLSSSDLEFLGLEYVRQVNNLDSGRQEIIDDYELWIENYEGDVEPPESEKPWEGASDAHLPITSTDVDILEARFMNAFFGQFPGFMIRSVSGRWTEFARSTQFFSEWLETTEIPLYKPLQQLFLTTIKYGSAVVYLPWENRPIKRMVLNENDEFIGEEDDAFDKPVPHVIHPKDFLLPLHSPDIQTAQWCGYRYKLTPPTLRLWRDREFFRRDAAEFLEELFAQPKGQENLSLQGGAEQRFDRVQEARERTVGLQRVEQPVEIDMVHIWARIDIDGDGLEEEVNFHMHEKTGRIARIAFNHYRHGRRPFIDFHFFPRDGIWYSIGVPEMLRNLQKNADVTFRQIQDNNTVKNTQSFKAIEGGSIKPNEPFHPAKIYFLRQMDEFEPLRLGDTSINTSVQDLQTQIQWAERRTGLSDPVAGLNVGDRTPATTTLALLQEAAKRIDLIIGGLRMGLAEMWMQVLELYAQFKPVVEFERPDGNKFELLEWSAIGDQDFRKRIAIKPTISTTALNKAVARQEMQGLLERTIAHNQTTAQLLDLFLQAQDPMVRNFLMKSITGQHIVMQRIYDTFDMAKDQDRILPDPEEFLPNVSQLQGPLAGAGGAGQPPTVPGSQTLLGSSPAGVAPATAPNRPAAGTGIPRLPGLGGGGGDQT